MQRIRGQNLQGADTFALQSFDVRRQIRVGKDQISITIL